MSDDLPNEESIDADLRENRDRLASLLEHIAWRLQEHKDLSAPPEASDLLISLLAILRHVVVQAEAILLLSDTQYAEAATTNVRAMLEAWLDLTYLLHVGDRHLNAQQHEVFAHLEYQRYLLTYESGSEAVAMATARLDEVKSQYPAAYSAVTAPVRTSKNFWSGITRSAMIDEVAKRRPDSPSVRKAFKMLSWDSHGVMAVARDANRVQLEDGSIAAEFGHPLSPQESGAFSAGLAVYFLADAWQEVTSALGVPPHVKRGAGSGFAPRPSA